MGMIKFRNQPLSRGNPLVPTQAGMAEYREGGNFFRRWGSGQDSCFRGNDVEVVLCGDEVSGRSGRCFFSLNSRMRGNCGFPPSRE